MFRLGFGGLVWPRDWLRVPATGGTPVPAPMPTPAPTLTALSGTFSLAENAPEGAVAGAIAGKTAGSTLLLADNKGGRFVLSGSGERWSIAQGPTPLDYEQATSWAPVVQEVLAGATNNNRQTTLTVTVTNVAEAPALSVLSLSGVSVPEGSPATIAILGATAGSTISIQSGALPARMTLDSGARTITGTATTQGSSSFTLRETLADSPNSPRDTAMSITTTAAAPSVPSDSLIAWTPAMIAAKVWYSATDQTSFRKADGTQATATTDEVDVWRDISGNARHALSAANGNGASTSATRGKPGAVETLGSFTGSPLRVGNGVATNRYNTPDGLLSMPSGSLGDLIYTFARIRPPATAVNRTLVGNSSGNFNTNINISDATAAGRVSPGPLRTDTTTRLEMLTQSKPFATGNTYVLRLNGSETLGTGGAGSSVAASRMCIGNIYGGSQGVDADLFEVLILPQGTSRANMQRLEGWVAHTYGQTALLPAGHPYKSAPPTVPAGTTSTAGWGDVNYAAPQQTWKGFMVQVENDAYEGGTSIPPTDPTTRFGVVHSLLPDSLKDATTLSDALCAGTEALRLKDAMFTPSGADGGYDIVRFSLWNQSYRGARVLDPVSGLAREVGPRWPSQVEQYRWLLERTSGVAVGWWSVAPHFKTTSSQSKGTIWAGGANARTVTLDSIYDETPGSQYTVQMDDLVSACFNEVVHVHTAIKPVKAVFINEAGNLAAANYGTTSWSGRLQASFWRRLRALLRADARFASCEFWIDCWDGPDPEIRAESWYDTDPLVKLFYHDITDAGNDADALKSLNTARFNSTNARFAALGIPYSWNSDEQEYFYDAGATAGKGIDWQAANTALWWAHDFELANAEWVNPMIHVGKHVGYSVANSHSKAEMYSSIVYRRSATYDQARTTSGDPYSAMDHGQWAWVPRNSNVTRLLLKTVRPGAVHYAGAITLGTGQQITGGINPGGREWRVVVNRSAAPLTVTVGLKSVAAYEAVYSNGTAYAQALVPARVTNAMALTVPVNSFAVVRRAD